MPKKQNTLLFDKKKAAGSIKKVAEAISSEFERKGDFRDIAFLGIQTKGLPLAQRITSHLKDKTGIDIPIGALDISMYRDDIGMRKTLPRIHKTEILFDINDKIIILVDDVLQTGRTIRAALDAITDYGRPRLIRLAVLIDRGMREFPIQADYVGASCHVSKHEKISVSWKEIEGEDAVYLLPSEQNRRLK